MTAAGSRRARLALVALAVTFAVLGFAQIRTDASAGGASTAAVAKASAITASQTTAERPAEPNHWAGGLAVAGAVVVALSGLRRALSQRREHRFERLSSRLTWHRRGPPLRFIS